MRKYLTAILLVAIVSSTISAESVTNAARSLKGNFGRTAQFPSKAFSSWVSSHSASIASANLIGFLQREHVVDGCGCIFFLTTNPSDPIFSDDFDDHVWMNIDGSDVQLTLVSKASTPKGQARRGQRTSRKYSATGIVVTIDFVSGKNYGDGNDQSGTITATKGSRTQSVRYKGFCGC